MIRKVFTKATVARGAAIAGSAALAGILVVSGSRAAFTDTTENPTNTWDAATLNLTDGDSNSAMFTASGLVPGDVVRGSITVDYVDDAAQVDIKMYGAGFTDTLSLGDKLNLSIGTSLDGTEIYSGTLADFASTYTDFSNGDSDAAWADVAPGFSDTFYFKVQLDPSADDTYQGGTAGIDFVWEAQSNATQS